MNQITPYEQIIAAKLDQLPPLPALADDIWLRIKSALDEDMPTDDDDFGGGQGGDDGPGGSPAGGPLAIPDSSWTGWSILLILGALSLLWIYRTGKFPGWSVPATEPGKNYRVLEKVPPNEAVSPPPAASRAGNAGSPAAGIPGKQMQLSPDSVSGQADSLVQAGGVEPAAAVPPGPDSASSVPAPGAGTAVAPVVPGKGETITRPDSGGGRKRPSGIKGINPDDYRIVPQKKARDST